MTEHEGTAGDRPHAADVGHGDVDRDDLDAANPEGPDTPAGRPATTSRDARDASQLPTVDPDEPD